jgi:hypothetical protein
MIGLPRRRHQKGEFIEGESMSTKVEGEAKIRAHGTVRVSLPATIAYNPEALKKSIGNLVERLGCPRCFSGADCVFTHERAFVADSKGTISAVTVELNPQPLPPRADAAAVSLARGVRYDINKVFKAVDKVIDLIGPCPCHSGIDILYLNELNVIGINEKIEAQQFGG